MHKYVHIHYNPGMTRARLPRSTPAGGSGCTCSKLRRLTRRVTAVYDRALAAAGMRVTQYSLLACLRGSHGIPMSQLAEALDLDRTTLTRNLKALLESGWVEVRAGPQDARIRLVHITAAGEAQWQAARAFWRQAQSEVTAAIGPANLAGLHDALDRYLPLFRPVTGAEGEAE
jgi:DNA-binding MarR family transcriptional regulator